MHLDRLEKAGLITGQLELSDDGKAMKYFELAPFDLRLTAEVIAKIVQASPGPIGPASSEQENETDMKQSSR